jgi:hypothetical protein
MESMLSPFIALLSSFIPVSFERPYAASGG